MAYTAPTTRATSDLVTASIWNTDLVNNISFLANPPSCRVYHNATQSLTNATETALSFNTERYDTDTMHDTVTNNGRITIKTAGLYVVGLTVGYAANATGIRYTSIRLNGGSTYLVQDTRSNATAGFSTLVNIGGIFKFAVNDFVVAYAYQNSGGALNVNADSATDFSGAGFWATWVGLG